MDSSLFWLTKAEFTCSTYGSIISTDDSSVKFPWQAPFLHFLLKFRKKWRKNLSWKFMDELSVKYLRIRKWTRWIWPMYTAVISFHFVLFEFQKFFFRSWFIMAGGVNIITKWVLAAHNSSVDRTECFLWNSGTRWPTQDYL